MNRVVPWAELVAVIEPVYPQADGPGRPPVGIERMLRLHGLQQGFPLSDPAVEEALYDSRAMRPFVGIDLDREPVPDETTICPLRHLLEAHALGNPLFARIGAYLTQQGLQVSRGTIVDATIISAPSSTKNRTTERDPGDASDQEREAGVLRHEGPYRRGQPDQADSFSGRDRRQCA
jgi:IS5 family transposase